MRVVNSSESKYILNLPWHYYFQRNMKNKRSDTVSRVLQIKICR